MKKYYFISYAYLRHTPGSDWKFVNELTDMHPLEWQLYVNESFNDGEYILQNWKQITAEEYNEYEGKIG